MHTALIVFALTILLAASLNVSASPTGDRDYPYRPVPFTSVKVSDAFWLPRIETNRENTISFAFENCETTGRIDNFRIAAGQIEGAWKGDFGFDDTDVTKIIEGASYSLHVHPDEKLDAYLDTVISYIAAAQEPDGYLYTLYTARHTSDRFGKVYCGPKEYRWDNIAWSHEFYNAGHMYEAGVAHYLATGKRDLLDVCIRNADLICDLFGPDGQIEPPGHQEIELGLIKLYRVTGDKKYLDQVKLFLDRRGRNADQRDLFGKYAQDHVPVTEQDEAVGHAVRANYMYAAMADTAALTGDGAYIKAIDQIWDNVVSHKLYLTGGTGATGHGEAYGENDELPNLTAYAETCAGIANVYWNHRMFCLHGDAKYIDVMERALYNGVISGVALDGKSFFYPNPLASNGEHARSPWFGCACCPSNMTRFIASVGGYMYAVHDNSVYVNLYAQGEAEVSLANQKVTIEQQTRYPWDGKVSIKITPEKAGESFALRLRIPGWAQNEAVASDLYKFIDEDSAPPTVHVNGEAVDFIGKTDRGYVVIERTWETGDEVTLDIPMPVRRVIANDNIEADRGRVALQRGPLVYCVEHPDVPNGKVHNLMLEDDTQLATEFRKDLLRGVQVITGTATVTKPADEEGGTPVANGTIPLTAIPYYAWAHRGKGEMAVWLPRTVDVVDPPQ